MVSVPWCYPMTLQLVDNIDHYARGVMVLWFERLLLKLEDLGSTPVQTKCHSSLLRYKAVGINWIQMQQIV